jgi:hypothetical protein
MLTAIERRILIELSLIYSTAGLIAWRLYMGLELGSIPQWLTAIAAIFALGIAAISVLTQREIARKRAAMDFFTKTEMDKHTLDQHELYKKAIKELDEYSQANKPLEKFAETEAYWHIRGYLNLHELMGVGINRDVFDDYVCYDFWSRELFRACRDAGPLIKWVRTQPGESATYIELLAVNKRWRNRDRVKR